MEVLKVKPGKIVNLDVHHDIRFVNDLYAIGLENKFNQWIIQLYAHQDLGDELFYIDIKVKTDNEALGFSPFYCENMGIEDRKVYELYIKEKGWYNTYWIDLDDFRIDNNYYIYKGYRTIRRESDMTELWFTFSCYIQLKGFLSQFINQNNFIKEYFTKDLYRDVKVEKMEHIKLLGTTVEIENEKYSTIFTAYEANTGPTNFKFVYQFSILTTDIDDCNFIRELLHSKIFHKEYSEIPEITDKEIVYSNETDFLYLFFKGEKKVALKMGRDIYEKTNLLDKLNYITYIKEGEM